MNDSIVVPMEYELMALVSSCRIMLSLINSLDPEVSVVDFYDRP